MPNQHARHLRSNQTEAEQKLWYHLRRKQLDGHRFRRQHPIDNYIVDFICLEQKLIIEVDGGQHGEATNIAKDQDRTTKLQAAGFQVLRFWNNEVLQNAQGVLMVISSRLQNSPQEQ